MSDKQDDTNKNAPKQKFTDEQNYLLAKAYKKISADPVIGCEQKKKTFWLRTHKEYIQQCVEHYKDPASCAAASQWKPDSLKNRFYRHMKPSVPNYNKAVKQTKERSGESDEDHAERVLQAFMVLDKKNRRNATYIVRVAEVLNEMAQFGGTHGNLEHDDRVNNGSVFSSYDAPRPMGSQAAKRQQFEAESSARKKEKIEGQKIAQYDGIKSTMDAAAAAAVSIAETLKANTEARHNDSLLKQAEQFRKSAQTYLDLGDKKMAKEYIDG